VNEIPLPNSLAANEVLIKWLVAPINPADLNIIEGVYGVKAKLPGVGGTEGVGIVVETGSNVKGVAKDDHVIPSKATGTWRTYGVLRDNELLRIPKDIKREYAATLSSPSTAIRLLEDFQDLKSGDVIIQNAANSSVGTAVMQLANARGIKTINIIRNRPDFADVVERMKLLGGYTVISDEYLLTPQFRRIMSELPKPKLALNCVGGSTATELARFLGQGGSLVTYGGMSHRPVVVPTSLFIFNDIKLQGFWLTHWLETHSQEERQKMLNSIFESVRSDKLKLWLETWKFDRFADALKKVRQPYRDRKVVLTFDS